MNELLGFTEHGGDIIKQMGIGLPYIIKKRMEMLWDNGIANADNKDSFSFQKAYDGDGIEINVSGDIDIRFSKHKSLVFYEDYFFDKKIKYKFGRVDGHFLCSHSRLISLEGAPVYVGGDFDCSNNNLKDLSGAPKEVGGNFYCHNNMRTLCHNNRITLAKPESSIIKGFFRNQAGFELINSISAEKPSIVNIDSNIEIVGSDFDFLRKTLFGNYKSSIAQDSIQFLAQIIPIYLVKEVTFLEGRKPDENMEIIDTLGYYTRLNRPHFSNTPSIFICPELIARYANNWTSFKVLLTKVIIHEYAHALMDTNDSSFKCSRNIADFFKWVEEPFANLLTLLHFKEFAPEYLGRVKSYIESQPPEYKLGAFLFDNSINRWKEWRDCKVAVCLKTTETQEWLDYVRNNQYFKEKSKLDDLFKKLFDKV